MPNKESPILYWDSCVFLSAIEQDVDRIRVISQLLEECENGKHRIFTSHLSIAEVCFAKAEKSGRAISEETGEKIDKLWDSSSPVNTVELHELIAHNAKGLIRSALRKGFGLKPPDAIHLATAKMWNVSEFHTYDAKLFKFSGVMGFHICLPHSQQMPMFPAIGSAIRCLHDTQWHWRKPRFPRPDRTSAMYMTRKRK